MPEYSLTWYEVLPWIVLVQWVIQLGMLLAGIAKRQILRPSTSIEPRSSWPRLSVVVAARNEEDCIENCLRSLLRQDFPNLEVIAVNDRSTDKTASMMERLAHESPDRLKVVHITSLPSGWFGKTHALHEGMKSATGEWVCFSDADGEQLSDRTMSIAMNEALEREVDLFTMTPQFCLTSVWETITVPICSWLMMVWFQPGRVNNPKLKTSYANGAFMLMKRSCYDAVGGWMQFRGQISEDVAFARAAKSQGLKLFVAQNDGLFRVRMYDSIRDSWNGWSRIFYGTLPVKALVLSTVRLVTCSILPTWGVLATLCGCWLATMDGGLVASPAFLAWLGVLIVQQIHAAVTFRVMGANVAWSLTAPLGHLILLGIVSRVMLSHLGLATMKWSGTVLHRGRITQTSLSAAASQS